ncbi:hypothetical protein EYF80_015564 [Liparis tanakae]|uniref:Uncharacterized protein n=1 Tax=Liparis tanakae TaxID=230148 RepID=A0A4Z2I7U7_9TELE|nr:hypothetical protein EYF80_015564 [Liparis tanakae]
MCPLRPLTAPCDRKEGNNCHSDCSVYLEQQQAAGQTGHQQQVVFGPPGDLLQAANGKDVQTCRSLLQLLHPVPTHGVQHRLQRENNTDLGSGRYHVSEEVSNDPSRDLQEEDGGQDPQKLQEQTTREQPIRGPEDDM